MDRSKFHILEDGCQAFGVTLTEKQIEQFEKYYELLVEWNKVMNLTGITEFDEVMQKHFVDSVLKSEIFIKEDTKTLIDVGTGAGFPGVPLKIMYPQLKVTLLDSLNKRLNFLNQVIEKLGLENIATVHYRAEDGARKAELREQFDCVVSRAVANMSTLCEYCLPYAKVGGCFVAYKSGNAEEEIDKAKKNSSLYNFVSPDGVRHQVWKISEPQSVKAIRGAFEGISSIYIADGHHRAASAVKVGLKRRAENPQYTGKEEFNYFLSVLFPHDQLMIMDYNRTVKDLNGLSKDEFLEKVAECFEVNEEDGAVRPQKKGEVGMYLDKQWYRLIAKPALFEGKDAVGSLDVSVLQDYLLGPVLGIGDPRTDSRIDFIGGIRGLKELERRADNDMKVSFSMYPTSITELFDVADQKLLMPPKSTWFEPKLRSGLFIHEI